MYNLFNLRGACNGRRLRIYGFTDLPPSLPLFSSTTFTRILKSSYRREELGRCEEWFRALAAF